MYGYTVSPQELHSNSSFSTSTTGDIGNLFKECLQHSADVEIWSHFEVNQATIWNRAQAVLVSPFLDISMVQHHGRVQLHTFSLKNRTDIFVAPFHNLPNKGETFETRVRP